MKLPLVGAALLSLIASEALAVSRYDVTRMTCAEVQARVEQEGAVVLSYRSWRVIGLPIYDRFAKSQQFCPDGTVAAPAGVPTADKKYCPVKKCFSSGRFVAR
jgi:hypothetical protein